MSFYSPLRRAPFTELTRDRCARGLLKLRRQIRDEIPGRTNHNTLLLATWNIRDFDSNKFGHGPRLPESFYYIAEIVSAFDLVAVQEVNRDLKALRKLMNILGPQWSYIVNDVTEGGSGNQERTAFIYDKNKILFRNLVGEIVLQSNELIQERHQFARTPFFMGFQCGWLKFNLCTAHLYYGEGGAGLERRIEEIRRLGSIISDKTERENENYILLGDFNIVSPTHRTMDALLENGFVIPEPLQDSPSNMYRNKFYDQIAFKMREDELHLGDSPRSAGAFNYYKSVFSATEDFQSPDGSIEDNDVDQGEWRKYYDGFVDEPEQLEKWNIDERGNPRTDDESKRSYYWRDWRTWQMSDHLPLWVQLKIDFSERYLEGLCLPAN